MKTKIVLLAAAIAGLGLCLCQAAGGGAPADTNAPIPRRAANDAPLAPAELPGRGLAQHDFFYAGEGSQENMYIVRQGKVVWSYLDPTTKGEISDATLLANGNILFAHQFGVTEITADKKVIWNYVVPKGFEVHTAQAVGTNHVLFIQNGNPATLKVVNITTGETNKEFVLPVRDTNSTHGQFRQARLTDTGTVIVAHMDLGKVCEYDASGKELWAVNAPGAWSAVPLKNGHILVTSNRGFIREYNRQGESVWEYQTADLPEIKIANLQTATRLSNGNTLINNWRTKGNGTAVQALEITADKKLVWGLRAWSDPDLGPSTIIQLLDEPGVPGKARFGNIE